MTAPAAVSAAPQGEATPTLHERTVAEVLDAAESAVSAVLNAVDAAEIAALPGVRAAPALITSARLALTPLVRAAVREALETEAVALQAVATVRGDMLHRQGREAEADVAYGIAAKMRLRCRDLYPSAL